MDSQRLQVVVDYLKTRPGHENVRATVRELCVVGLNIPDRDVNFEVPVPEVHGRIDALFGATIFEFKRDLKREREDAEEGLTRYLKDRERASGRRYLGIATDGAEFIAYEIRDGRLAKLEEFVPTSGDPRSLLRWLDTATTVRADLTPDPVTIRSEFGRESLVFNRSIELLRKLWSEAKLIPEAQLKIELWSRHLEFVYGTLVETEELFLQHTYLTIIAKMMAIRVVESGPVAPEEILAGSPFTQVGLHGAVETDFFDWIRLVDGGSGLVGRIAAQVDRFRLADIEVDILKVIYESLIDPKQRHYLGEYYTPDWLAQWVCEQTLPDPLNTRVLDPSCGSGTFLFHAIRRFLSAADKKNIPIQKALDLCTDHILGLDVHPVAVLFARVTYLLAIGPDRLRARTDQLFVPVYLGDAMQWDVRPFFSEEEVEIAVPGEPPLRFPGSVAVNPKLLETVLRSMREFADQQASRSAFESWLNANCLLPIADRAIIVASYEQMRSLHAAGRNHIWTYIVRNLTRPLWLTRREGKPDVLLGNPPWLRYNAMSPAMQTRFRTASKERGLWVGGKLATHQDLSGYFFARAAERYLARDGKVAFVMPLAALSRGQYKGFRTGRFADKAGNVIANVRFDGVWTFDSDVQPLFEVPSCVIFARKTATVAPLPVEVTAFHGQLPRRDATASEARQHLTQQRQPWPASAEDTGASEYRGRFRQGATIVPRRLAVVVSVQGGRFGSNPNAPIVESRRGNQDKLPWKALPPIKQQIESRFLRPLLLGESIAPFRLLNPATAIVPWDSHRRRLVDAKGALDLGHAYLAAWLKKAEALWEKHGISDMTLTERWNYHNALTNQFPVSPIRVLYAASGTLPCAMVLTDESAVIEHKLYWAPVRTLSEGRYLAAILGSEAGRVQVEHLQSRGQWGARDFDKVIFTLPIPRFDPRASLHNELSALGVQAERIARAVDIEEGTQFQRARRTVRIALADTGVSQQIDRLVMRLVRAH